MQNLVTFVSAGPAARVSQKMHVLKQDGTEKGCKFGITLIEVLHKFSDETGIHGSHCGPARDLGVNRKECGQLRQDGNKVWQNPVLPLPTHECGDQGIQFLSALKRRESGCLI